MEKYIISIPKGAWLSYDGGAFIVVHDINKAHRFDNLKSAQDTIDYLEREMNIKGIIERF